MLNRKMLFLSALAALLGFAVPGMAEPTIEAEAAVAYEEGVPGGVVANAVQVVVEVVAIDHVNRTATILRPDGETVTMTVGPEAVHFDEVVVGDMVKVTMVEELVIQLDESGTAVDGAAAVVAFGDQPGGMAGSVEQVVATVTAIDLENHTATLQFEDGTERTIPVRDDIDLTQHQVGEKVVFQLREMFAIDIEPHAE